MKPAFRVVAALAVTGLLGTSTVGRAYELRYRNASPVTHQTPVHQPGLLLAGTIGRIDAGSCIEMMPSLGVGDSNRLGIVACKDFEGHYSVEAEYHIYSSNKFVSYRVLDQLVPYKFGTPIVPVLKYEIYMNKHYMFIQTYDPRRPAGKVLSSPLFFGMTDQGMRNLVTHYKNHLYDEGRNYDLFVINDANIANKINAEWASRERFPFSEGRAAAPLMNKEAVSLLAM